MSGLPAKCSDKATSKQIKRETLEPNIIIPMLCSDDETPPPLTDNGLSVGPLTTVKCEVVAVCGKEPKIEVSIADVKPPNTPILAEPVSSVPPPVFKYGCPRCPKEFDDKIDRMLHEQIHTFQEIPRISDISGFRFIDLDAAERRTIYGQGDETHQTDVEESNTAEEVGSEIENESFNMHDANVDNTEDFGDKTHSIWDVDSESESSNCDGSSDEECSENDMNSSNGCRESSNVGNAEDASNAKSHNASAKHRTKSSPNAKEARPNEATVSKKESNSIRKHGTIPDGDGKFTCSYCERMCRNNHDLQKHLMIHTGEKPHKCDVCEKVFNRRAHCLAHKMTHTGQRPHKCDVCGRGFITKGHCFAHEMNHTGKRPYKCTDCDKTFALKWAYTRHCKLHTGEGQGCCQFCGKRFTRADSLKYHVSLHKGPKPYICLICKKNMSSSDEWKRHVEENHKDAYEEVAARKREKKKPRKKSHECTTCGKCFQSPSHLVIHESVHTGDRPFACEFCDRQFTRVDNLNMHLLTHSGTKPFVCIICKIPFSTKDEMVSHRQMTHENEQRLNEKASAALDGVASQPVSTEMADN